jgi:hypothetical protein
VAPFELRGPRSNAVDHMPLRTRPQSPLWVTMTTDWHGKSRDGRAVFERDRVRFDRQQDAVHASTIWSPIRQTHIVATRAPLRGAQDPLLRLERYRYPLKWSQLCNHTSSSRESFLTCLRSSLASMPILERPGERGPNQVCRPAPSHTVPFQVNPTVDGPRLELDRCEVADGLTAIVTNHYSRVSLNQQSLALCGPAAFWTVVAARHPVAVAQAGTDLYESGKADLGGSTWSQTTPCFLPRSIP